MGLEPWRPFGSGDGSRASADAARNSLERGLRSVLIRLRRSAITFFGLLAALIVYNIASGWMGFLNLLGALVLVVMASIAIMFVPVRDKRREAALRDGPIIDGTSNVRLDRLAQQTEDWLLERCRALPSQASGSLDRIIDRLRDLQQPLAGVRADSALGGEAQRLIGQHLPSLVTTYLSLPPAERGFQESSSASLADSLRIVADRMDELCERVAEEKRMGFETERRFIDSRYGDDERLRSDR